MIRRITLAALAVAVLAVSSLSADAGHRRDHVAVGTLECRSPVNVTLIFAVKDYDCRFFSRSGRTYRYTGRVVSAGFQAGITAREVLLWHVYAPTREVDRTALRGYYSGAHAGIGLVIGIGANVLVGGSRNTISLQPVSVEANVGVNLALSVAALSLY